MMPPLLRAFFEAGLVVDDLRLKLPTNPLVPWWHRELWPIDGIVVHHTAYRDVPAKNIAEYHIRIKTGAMPNGWPGLAYTFLIHTDGSIDFCHRLRDWGPQAYGVNAISFGVALSGNFVAQRPNLRMIGSLVTLIDVLQDFFFQETGHELWVKPHRYFSNSKCPGLAWEAYQAAAKEIG